MRLGAVVEGRDDHALLAGIAAPGDDLVYGERAQGANANDMQRTTTRPTLRLWGLSANALVQSAMSSQRVIEKVC